jgi:hypothetical protein
LVRTRGRRSSALFPDRVVILPAEERTRIEFEGFARLLASTGRRRRI